MWEYDGKWQGNDVGEDQRIIYESYFCRWNKDAKNEEGAREDLDMIIEESKNSNIKDEHLVDGIKVYLNTSDVVHKAMNKKEIVSICK